MKESDQERARKHLKPYRKQIDALDDQILKLLGRRFGIIRKVAAVKARHDLPAFLYDRVVEVIELSMKRGKKYGIDPAFARMLYSALIHESIRMEEGIKAQSKKRK